MSEDASPVPLQPGERVLWQGRLAVGAPWPSFGRLALGAVALWVALVAPFAVLARWSLPDLAVFFGVALAWFYGTIALSKVVGPSYPWIFFLPRSSAATGCRGCSATAGREPCSARKATCC